MKSSFKSIVLHTMMLLVASAIVLLAQVPQGINYQAVVRNAQNNVIANDNIQVRFTLRNSAPNGIAVYQETHTVQTNEYGMFSVIIGKGNTNSGSFTTIDWSASSKYLQVEFKASSNPSYIDMGTMQLMSTPYALNAQTANALSNAAKISPDNIDGNGAGTGQVLKWDGTHWIPGTDVQASGGATYSAGQGIEINGSNVITNIGDVNNTNELQTLALNGNQLSISNGNSITLPAGTNYSAGTGINITNGVISATQSGGVAGINLPLDTTLSTTTNVFKVTNSSTTGTGDMIRLTNSGLGRGVYAQISNSSNIVSALRGETNGGGYGVQGVATGNGNAGFFQISNAASTSSVMNVTTNGIGSGVTVQLTNASNGARGLDVLQSGVGPGVFATSAGGNAVWGITSSISAAGVIGDNTFGEAVVGRNRGGNGVGAVVGRNDSSGYGVRGFNTKNGYGVLGQAGISGGTGVGGRFENVNAANTSSACEVATNGNANGLKVTNSAATLDNGKAAILSTTTDGTAISGTTNGTTTSDAGIRGTAANANAYAAYFSGKVHVAGTLSKTAGTFKIDHPQDPANKYLVHSFVESPDMMNIYNGNIVTDGNGKATVTLPSYFEAENINFKYQLTVIGQFAQVIIAKEVSGNQFEIMTDKPNVKVSWQVTGVRNDVFAQQNRYVDVVEKEEENKGYYVYPQGYGQPLSKGIYSKGFDEYAKTTEQIPSTNETKVSTASETPVTAPQPATRK
ncbi:MAG: hypothetical protein U0Y96_02745 [Candidatus Kapaibacterium sp.]